MPHFPVCLNLTFFSLNLFLCWSSWKIYRPEILSRPRDVFGILKTCHGVPITIEGSPKWLYEGYHHLQSPRKLSVPFSSLLPPRTHLPPPSLSLIFFSGHDNMLISNKALTNYPPFSFSKNPYGYLVAYYQRDKCYLLLARSKGFF